MRYNLFRGGADMARRRQTAHLINEAAELRNRTCRQVVESVRLSWAARESLARQLGSIQRQVNFSQRTRAAYEKQFTIGRRTLLDLLDSENELFLSNQDLINAKVDHEFASYRILAAMGRLIDSLQAQLPDEAKPTATVAMEAVGYCGIEGADYTSSAPAQAVTVTGHNVVSPVEHRPNVVARRGRDDVAESAADR